MKRREISCRAFTLIELLIVTIILVVIVGISVPNFSPAYKKFQLQKTTDDLAYLMRYAQSRAIVRGVPVRIVFDPQGLSFWLEQAVEQESQGFADEEEVEYLRVEDRFGKAVEIPDGFELRRQQDTVTFYPDGRIEKLEIAVCIEERCFLVLTKGQRGHVRVYPFDQENL